MIVVADASPINYLVLVNSTDLLKHLYAEVVLPRTVLDELSRDAAPLAVKSWVRALPPWIVVAPVADALNPATIGLDAGEAEAITYALKVGADLILIDELKGRHIAREHGLRLSGTLGVLREAHKRGMVDARIVYSKLRQTSFNCSSSLESRFLMSLERT